MPGLLTLYGTDFLHRLSEITLQFDFLKCLLLPGLKKSYAVLDRLENHHQNLLHDLNQVKCNMMNKANNHLRYINCI